MLKRFWRHRSGKSKTSALQTVLAKATNSEIGPERQKVGAVDFIRSRARIPVAGSCAVLLTALLLWPAPVARAQGTSAEIRGTVRDATGAVLPGVSLTITHRGSGQERRVSTDSGGNYVVASLPVGEYVLRVELTNFKTQVREGIALPVGERVRVDFVLAVGSLSEEITVTDSVPLLRAARIPTSRGFGRFAGTASRSTIPSR